MGKTARWIRRTHILRSDEYVCSACGGKCDRPKKTCPHCGAVMKGAKSDTGWVDEMEAIDAFLDD